MAALTEYTSYDEIRSVLGVSSDELEDSTLALGLYSSALNAELRDVGTGLVSQYFTTLDVGTPTDDEQAFIDYVRLFATYSVAKQLSTSLPLFAPKDVSDGKATIGRFTTDPYAVTIKKISEYYDRYKERLAKSYATIQSSSVNTTAITFIMNGIPSFNPVTGA